LEKVVINNDKKKNKKVIATIISLIVAIFIIITGTLAYFLVKSHVNISISVDPTVISVKNGKVHLGGDIKNIKKKNLGDEISLLNSEVLLGHGDVYYYDCKIENNGSGDIDFDLNLLIEHTTNSTISYTLNDGEKTVYGGDSFNGNLKYGESCSLIICYEVNDDAKSAFIDTGVKIVVTKGGEK